LFGANVFSRLDLECAEAVVEDDNMEVPVIEAIVALLQIKEGGILSGEILVVLQDLMDGREGEGRSRLFYEFMVSFDQVISGLQPL
jgi:hypothetical protein